MQDAILKISEFHVEKCCITCRRHAWIGFITKLEGLSSSATSTELYVSKSVKTIDDTYKIERKPKGRI